MSSKSILHKAETLLQLDKLSESKGMLSFLTARPDIIDLCIYKSDFLFLFSDYSITVFNPQSNTVKFEIKEAKSLSPFRMLILFYMEDIVETDSILLLSETKLFLIDFSKFSIGQSTSLSAAVNVQLHFTSSLYLAIVLHKAKVSVYSITKNPKALSGVVFTLHYAIDINEAILSDALLLHNKLIVFEVKEHIHIYSVNYDNSSSTKNYLIAKTDYFKNEFSEVSSFNQYLLNSKVSNKSIDAYKRMKLHMSKLSNCLYAIFLNKIYVFLNKYEAPFEEMVVFREKVIKSNLILFSRVVDPFLFLVIENRLYLYFILDLTKCIDSIELSSVSFSFIRDKNVDLLFGLHLIHLPTEIIQYDDSILIEKMKHAPKQSMDFLLNSSQYVLLLYSYKAVHWVYLSNFSETVSCLKSITIEFASRLLSLYIGRTAMTKRESAAYIHHIQLLKENEKFLLFKSLELIYNFIALQDYANALVCLNHLRLDLIFIVILLRKMIRSRPLLLLIEYFYKFTLGKYLIFYSEFEQSAQTYTYSSLLNKSKELIQQVYQNQNDTLISLTKRIEIKELSDMTTFLKFFYDKFLQFREDIRASIPKSARMLIDFDAYLNNLSKVEVNDKEELNSITQFSVLNEVNEHFIMQNVTEDELSFCIIENVVFLLNAYAYELSKQPLYASGLRLMIKSSYNVLDKNMIALLQSMWLEEEMLLFYYCKGNYTKCISSIEVIYLSLDSDSTPPGEEATPRDKGDQSKESPSNEVIEEEDPVSTTDLFSRKSSKLQWLICYVKLICKISGKLKPGEFNEYITWALERNSNKTIDILFENKRISDKRIDEEFIKIIQPFGVDAAIYYLKRFAHLEENEEQINEMINLYTIKLTLLFEAREKEPSDSAAKWNKEILNTREDFCHFLITNRFYNISHAYDKISKLALCQNELGIVLIKQANYVEGIPMLFVNNYNPMKMILLLIESIPQFELVSMIIEKVISLEISDKQKTIEEMIMMILEKIERRSHLVIRLLSTKLFDELNCEKMLEFVMRNMSLMESKRENYKLEAGLIENKTLSQLNLLYDIQGTKLAMTEMNKCLLCFKQFSFASHSSIVYVQHDKYYHPECYNFYYKTSNQ